MKIPKISREVASALRATNPLLPGSSLGIDNLLARLSLACVSRTAASSYRNALETGDQEALEDIRKDLVKSDIYAAERLFSAHEDVRGMLDVVSIGRYLAPGLAYQTAIKINDQEWLPFIRKRLVEYNQDLAWKIFRRAENMEGLEMLETLQTEQGE